jgi:hypothetical protein
MAEDTIVEYCALNVAASPHPEGVYRQILDAAALKPVNYRGDQFATISVPTEREPGFLQGRLVSWTEINQDEPAIFKDKLTEVDLSDLNIQIPENVGFNGRIFLYTFRVRDHVMFIETKNEFGKRLSPRLVEKILTMLFSAETLGVDAPLVEVTLMPEEDALARILRLGHLKRLEIHLERFMC